MTFTGTLTDINIALKTLKYTAGGIYKHWNSVDGGNKDNVTLFVNDRGSGSTHRSHPEADRVETNLTDTHVLYIFVRSVNDAPEVFVPGGEHVVDEDTVLKLDQGVVRSLS